MNVELHLVRHARAAERGPAYPEDALRPLVAKGEAQARALALAWERIGVSVDVLATSPWLRARQTAEALRARAGAMHVLEALARSDLEDCASALARLAAAEPMRVVRLAAVGHEPWLSGLASWLVAGDASVVRVAFRKAAMMTLTGELRRGGMALEAFVPVRVVRAFLDGERG